MYADDVAIRGALPLAQQNLVDALASPADRCQHFHVHDLSFFVQHKAGIFPFLACSVQAGYAHGRNNGCPEHDVLQRPQLLWWRV